MALRELLAQFGIEVETEKLDHANEKIEHFVHGLEKTAKAVATAFAVKEVFEFAESTAHAIHQVEATAAALGISTEATQEFGYASKAAGEDAGELLNMMGRLQVTAAQAAKGGEGGKAFHDIGVNVKDASGKIKAADVLLEDVAEGIKKTEDPAKRAAAAVGLFGRQGRVLLPFLIRGRDGVRALRAEFQELGGGFDEEAIEKASAFEHAMAKVSVVIDGIKGAIVKGLFPVLTWIADTASAIGGWFVRMSKNTNIVRNSLILLGAALTPLAIQMAIAFAPILLAGAALAFIVALFDDIVTMFEGGHSAIGHIIDKIFGKGTSAQVVKEVRDAWDDVKASFRDMWPYVKQVYDALKWIVEHTVQISGSFGDWLGKKANASAEATAEQSGDIKKGRAGLTFEQNAGALDAQSYLEAANRGEDLSKWQPPNVTKGTTREQVIEAVKQWIPMIQTDPRYASFQPQTYGPTPQPAAEGNISVTIQGTTGMKEHEVKRAMRDAVLEARQQANRNAKYAVSQAAQK